MATRRFAFIADGDVFMHLQFDDQINGERSQGAAAGLLSSPTIIEITDRPDVVPGWTWDGVEFKAPE